MPAAIATSEFGQHLREARLDAGLTQTQLADLLDVKQATISEWETDPRRLPSYNQWPAIENVLSLSGGSVYGWVLDASTEVACFALWAADLLNDTPVTQPATAVA